MTTATAAVTESKSAPFELQEVEIGELRDDEVLVDVAASGICHTDLICRDQWIPVPLPAVLGHEGAGTVVAVGRSVTKVSPGDRVGMTFDSCGRCRACQTASPAYCFTFFEHNFAARHGRVMGQARAGNGPAACMRTSSASRASPRAQSHGSGMSRGSTSTYPSKSRHRSGAEFRQAPVRFSTRSQLRPAVR